MISNGRTWSLHLPKTIPTQEFTCSCEICHDRGKWTHKLTH